MKCEISFYLSAAEASLKAALKFPDCFGKLFPDELSNNVAPLFPHKEKLSPFTWNELLLDQKNPTTNVSWKVDAAWWDGRSHLGCFLSSILLFTILKLYWAKSPKKQFQIKTIFSHRKCFFSCIIKNSFFSWKILNVEWLHFKCVSIFWCKKKSRFKSITPSILCTIWWGHSDMTTFVKDVSKPFLFVFRCKKNKCKAQLVLEKKASFKLF